MSKSCETESTYRINCMVNGESAYTTILTEFADVIEHIVNECMNTCESDEKSLYGTIKRHLSELDYNDSVFDLTEFLDWEDDKDDIYFHIEKKVKRTKPRENHFPHSLRLRHPIRDDQECKESEALPA